MSVAPMLPSESASSTVRGPRGAVVIPFPAASPLAELAELEAEPAGPVQLTEPPGPAELAEPAPAEPVERPISWPVPPPRRVARPRRVVRPARPPHSSALRLTRRGRVVLALAVLLAAVAFGVLASRLVHTRTTIPPSAPAVVEVQPGDTVWSIARRVAPQADTRAVVDAIIARNGLVGGAVHPGQRLVIRP